MARTPFGRSLRSLVVLGAVTLGPALVGTQTTHASPPAPWERSWDAAWARATQYYTITAATTLARDPGCQGDLGFQPRIKELTQAIADHRYGDATRLLAQVHDKSLCLSLEGTRGLEFALGGFMHRAVTELTGADQQIAVFGALNAGTLVFDQLQYTQRSWWLPMMKFHADKLAPVIARYPKGELGFYAYDWSRNTLSNGVDPMVMAASMRDFGNYADGSCSMLEMAGAGFKCKGWVGRNGMGGGGGGGGGGRGGGAGGGLPSIPSAGGSVACMTAAAQSTGIRGKLGCAAKAVAGMTFDPRTTSPQGLLSQGIEGGAPGIKDPRCALSADAGNGGGQTDPAAAKKEPTRWDKIKDAAGKAVDIVIDVVVSVFDKTPPVVSDLKPLASDQGADAVRGGLQMLQAQSARDALLSDDAAEKYEEKRDGRVMTDPKANQQRTAGDLGGLPGSAPAAGACGRGSNAARRAHALFDCISGDSPKPTNRGPNNPLVARHDPDQIQTPVTGAFACVANGGDLPRSGFNDPKCANTRCVEGAMSCPCDKPGGGMKTTLPGTITPRITATTSPNCAEPPCGALAPPRSSSGPITAPPKGGPGGGPQPVPLGRPRP